MSEASLALTSSDKSAAIELDWRRPPSKLRLVLKTKSQDAKQRTSKSPELLLGQSLGNTDKFDTSLAHIGHI